MRHRRGGGAPRSASAGVPHRRVLLALFLLGLATAGIELLLGRRLICGCGTVRLWAGQVRGPENSQQLADWYSLTHVVHGLLLFAAVRWLPPNVRRSTRLIVAAAIEAAWEVVENTPYVIGRYRAATVAFGYTGDTVLNSLADIGCMLLGYALAARAPAKLAVAAGLALELVALATVRDNLTLNVLMLIHPVAAVRAWQAG